MQPDSVSAEDEFTKATVPKVLDADFNMEQCPEHPLNLSQQSLGSLESCYNEQNTDDSLYDSGHGSVGQGPSHHGSDGVYSEDASSEVGSLALSQAAWKSCRIDDDKCSTTTRVLLGLDTILRDKVNMEMEEFRGTIQCLLDEQLNRIQHLIKLSADFTPQEENNGDYGEPVHDDHQEFAYEEQLVERSVQDKEETSRNQNLLQLFLHASKITNTITSRVEFQVQHPP